MIKSARLAPKKPEAVLFDLDGTLLDSAPHFTDILNGLLTDAAKPLLPIDQVRPRVSGGVSAMVQCAFGGDLSNEALTTLKNAFLRDYAQLIANVPPLYFAGVEAVLQALSVRGIPFGIVTNKHQRFAEPILAKTTFKDSWQCVIYGDTLITPKPSPEPLYLACQRLQVVGEDTWFVGDGRVDMLAAKAAGSVGLLATYGYVEPDWRTWPCDYALHQLTDLITLLSL